MSLDHYGPDNPIEHATERLVMALSRHLDTHKHILWLVCGGSNIAVAVEVARRLQRHALDFSRLTVMLTDERYGPVDHKDSNWRQLLDDGFILPGAVTVPVLTGADLAPTVTAYAQRLQQELHENDFKIGLFGLGADGHTAGILPDSPGVTSDNWAVGYDAATYVRVTMTAIAIKALDHAVLVGTGAAKWPQLERLGDDLSPVRQPVQLLKRVPVLEVFSDYKEKQ